jgi:hypothetical protein
MRRPAPARVGTEYMTSPVAILLQPSDVAPAPPVGGDDASTATASASASPSSGDLPQLQVLPRPLSHLPPPVPSPSTTPEVVRSNSNGSSSSSISSSISNSSSSSDASSKSNDTQQATANLDHLMNLPGIGYTSQSKASQLYCNSRKSRNHMSTGPLGSLPARYSLSARSRQSRLLLSADVRSADDSMVCDVEWTSGLQWQQCELQSSDVMLCVGAELCDSRQLPVH